MSLLEVSVQGMAWEQLFARLKSTSQEPGWAPPVPNVVQSNLFFSFFSFGGRGKGVAIISFLSKTFILQLDLLPSASSSSQVKG